MSWRPKRQAHLSIHEFAGIAESNTRPSKDHHMTDLQMAAELEKKGWNVNKERK